MGVKLFMQLLLKTFLSSALFKLVFCFREKIQPGKEKEKRQKCKEERQKRKEEQYRIKLAKQVVDKANELEDPLAPFPVFHRYNKNEIDAILYTKRVTQLDDEIKNWIFDLTKRNMKDKYETCSWGWDDDKKYEELTEDQAWYMIAKSNDSEGKLLGFSHFRFDLDEGIEVLYCYEFQLEPLYHRKGLGKFMMQILELIAFSNCLKKVVLTILKNNEDSMFFKAINYQLDESSPIDDEENYYPYEILSKINKKLIVSD